MRSGERRARRHEAVVGGIRPDRASRGGVRAALRGAPAFEDVAELLDRAGLEVHDLGLPRPDGRAATPVQLDLALGLLGRLLDRIVPAVGGYRLGLRQHLELQRRLELAARRHGLQCLGEARVAAGAQRDVDVAAAAARACQAELVPLASCRRTVPTSACRRHHQPPSSCRPCRPCRRAMRTWRRRSSPGQSAVCRAGGPAQAVGPGRQAHRGRQAGRWSPGNAAGWSKGWLTAVSSEANVPLLLCLSLARCRAGGTCRKSSPQLDAEACPSGQFAVPSGPHPVRPRPEPRGEVAQTVRARDS